MGMETFGKQQDPPVGHLPIPSTFTAVKAEYDKLQPDGGATLYPTSLIDSIAKIRGATGLNSGHVDDVKIIVFLSDGGSILQDTEYNNIISLANGDGSDQQQIRIITICYTNNKDEPSGAVQLRNLAADTGGVAYIAGNALELADKFDQALQFIMDLMGEGSTMNVNFDDIIVNPSDPPMDGLLVYDYIPAGIAATLLDDEIVADPDKLYSDARTRINRPDGTQYYQNQISQWPYLEFSIGKIPLTKSWCTTFRLKAKQSGCYNAFGENSVIDLGLGAPPQPLPDLPICVSEIIPNKGPLTGTVVVENLHELSVPSEVCGYSDFIPLQWDTTYDSSISTNIATETVSYRIDNGIWKQFDVESVPIGEFVGVDGPKTTFDVRTLPSGDYEIMVKAYGGGGEAASSNIVSISVCHISKDPHIKLE